MASRVPLSEPAALPRAIRQWRLSAGMSQSELARRIGTAQSAVSRWERGHDEPRLSTLVAILRACGLTVELAVDADVDRAQIRQHLALTPRQRLESLANVGRLRTVARPET
ncbi:MAG: helix-turn-helix transcriptional regulator [Acidimicrobiia bacterium]